MKKRNFYPFLILFGFLLQKAEAQTFNGTGGQIPDNGTAVDFTLTVSGLPTSIDTSTFGLEEVCLNIIHTWDSDLDISLIAPDGTSVMLISGVGGGGDNFLGTCLQSDANNSITAGNPPFFGTFRPMGQMGIVNNGQDPNGVWTLHIMDTYPFADQGTLLGWSISFSNDPATYFSFSASNLPIVKINTSGQSIPQGPKITAMMGIIDNGPGMMNHINDSANDYNGYIGIEIRGHSSSGFSQKQYNVETRDSAGDNLNVSILDMPAENDWVLYAPFNDKSLLRNALTYELTRQMGRYASRARFCELVLNGEYKGVYTFFEKVKRDSNRVDIASLSVTDTSGADVTGGYICSVDWPDNNGWISNYPPDPTNPQNNTVFYQYIYPQDDVILHQQEQYIQQFVDSFETALLSASFDDPVIGWRKYAGEGSFVDFFIMNELSKNVDGYRLSTFFYKEKITDGNKLHMGPVWDFNLAWHNADYCGNQAFGGWAYQITNYCSWDFPFWWRRLDQDTTFRNSVRCRWDELRATVLDTSNIFGYIDSIASLLNDAQERHYFIYPILGTYVWPNPSPLAQTYQEEVDNLKTWIGQRIAFMDLNLPGNCITTGLSSSEQDLRLFIYPNPANDWIDVRLAGNPVSEISVYSMMGDKVLSTDLKGSASDIRLDVSSLAKGAYFIKATGADGKVVLSKFVKM